MFYAEKGGVSEGETGEGGEEGRVVKEEEGKEEEEALCGEMRSVAEYCP